MGLPSMWMIQRILKAKGRRLPFQSGMLIIWIVLTPNGFYEMLEAKAFSKMSLDEK